MSISSDSNDRYPFTAKLEIELKKLESSIDSVEKNYRFSESNKKHERSEDELMMARNASEIKQLNAEIDELKTRIRKRQSDNEKIIADSLMDNLQHSESSVLEDLKRKKGKLVVQEVDSKQIELLNKSKALAQELETHRRKLQANKQIYSAMCSKCDDAFENEPTELDCIQYSREVEKGLARASRNVAEAEVINLKLKAIKEKLEKANSTCPLQILEVQEEFKSLERNIDRPELGNDAHEHKHEYGDCAEAYKKRKGAEKTHKGVVHQTAFEEREATERLAELQKVQESCEMIKSTLGVYDIQEVESKMLLQKSLHTDLSSLKDSATKQLQELKQEKRDLQTKMDFMRGKNAASPIKKLKEGLTLVKNKKAEQEKRVDVAYQELKKLESLSDKVTDKLLELRSVIRKNTTNENEYYKEASRAVVVVDDIENMLHKNLRNKKIHFIRERNNRTEWEKIN